MGKEGVLLNKSKIQVWFIEVPSPANGQASGIVSIGTILIRFATCHPERSEGTSLVRSKIMPILTKFPPAKGGSGWQYFPMVGVITVP